MSNGDIESKEKEEEKNTHIHTQTYSSPQLLLADCGPTQYEGSEKIHLFNFSSEFHADFPIHGEHNATHIVLS